jgi:hypothetical protein
VCCEYPNRTPRTSAVVLQCSHIPVALSPCYRFCFSALHTSQTPASVSPVSHVSTLEAPSFLHQLVLFVDCQSVDIHHIRITFFSGEVVLPLCGLLLPGVFPHSFNGSVHLVKLVVNRCCPFVPVVDGLEWGLKFHQLECQAPGQCLLEQFDGQGVCCVNF